MGPRISKLNNSSSTLNLGEYDLQDITPLGKKPVTPINIKVFIDKNKIYTEDESIKKLNDIQETFNDIIDTKNERINNLIRYETLLMNYANKNNVVIKDLDERINEQNINIKDSTENNYKNIVKARNLVKTNNEIETTHLIMIIAIILFTILGTTAGLLIYKKRMKVEIRTI